MVISKLPSVKRNSDEKIKIVIFSPGFPPWNIGGEEYYAYYQAKELRKLGNEVYVIASNVGNITNSSNKSTMFYSLRARLTLSKPQMLRYLFTTVFVFFSFLKLHLRPHVIHAHDPYGEGLAAVIIKKIFGIKVVVTWHAAELVDTAAKFSVVGDACRRVVLKNANCIIVNSEFFKELAIKAVGDKSLDSKIYVIPPGVDADKFSSLTDNSNLIDVIPPDSQVILAVCRLEKIKGLDILIRAAPGVEKNSQKLNSFL